MTSYRNKMLSSRVVFSLFSSRPHKEKQEKAVWQRETRVAGLSYLPIVWTVTKISVPPVELN